MALPNLRAGLFHRRSLTPVEKRRVHSRGRARGIGSVIFFPAPFPEVVAPLIERFPAVPYDSVDQAQHRVQIARAANRINQGKINVVGEMTLAINSIATLLRDERLSDQSAIGWDPLTANARLELVAGGMWSAPADRTTGQILVHHSSNAQTDRTFRYVVLG